jgi:predicted solute-binding protein
MRIGIPANLYCKPLLDALSGRKGFTLDVSSFPALAHKLRQHDLQTAVVSPIEYARESSEYRIVASWGISSRSGIALHVKKGLKTIRTIAADPSFAAELVLARIVLAEEFEIIPAIVPMRGSVDEMLTRADAAMAAGDAFPRESEQHPDGIDIVELWSEMLDLPYVHGVLVAREGDLPTDDFLRLRAATSVLTSHSGHEEQPARLFSAALTDAEMKYLEQFSYVLTEESEDGLQEFLHYAHYHGILPDIPSIRYYLSEAQEDEEP